MKKNRRKILSGSRKILFAILAMFLSLSASAQQITASGQVLDAQNEPLIGVSVQEKGTTNGAITDLDGNFSLNVQQNAILVFSYVVLLYSSQRLLYMVSRSRYYWYHWRHSQSEWYLHLPDYKCISEYHLLSGMHFPKCIHLQFALQ